MTAVEPKGLVNISLSELRAREDNLPIEAYRLFGCLHCENRSTDSCPVYDETTMKSELPSKEGICDQRKMWILLHTPIYDHKPTLAEWRLDMLKSLGMVKMMNNEKHTKYLMNKINMLGVPKNKQDKSILDGLYTQLNKTNFNYSFYWRELSKLDDSQRGREMPRKIEGKIKHVIRPSDVSNMLRKANEEQVIDTDYNEVDKE